MDLAPRHLSKDIFSVHASQDYRMSVSAWASVRYRAALSVSLLPKRNLHDTTYILIISIQGWSFIAYTHTGLRQNLNNTGAFKKTSKYVFLKHS